ncbi:MAG: subclass B3 metallo-beta-lactamase [Pseudoxanthomonas sp.]
MRFLFFLIALLTASFGAQAADAVPACPADAGVRDGWSTRAPPRKIFGNTYYVGTCGIGSILIVGSQGAVLIDGATEQAPPLIEANIRALGFDPRLVKFILNTHEHSDHAGGLAQLQRDTGAPVLARALAATTLRRGASDRSDPQFEQLDRYPPVADVRVLAEGQVVQLGDLRLTAHATPGHAPGSTSWTWRSCEGAHCLSIAYADSLSALSDGHYRYLDHPDYVAAFRRSFDSVASLPCDILLTPHPLVSDQPARMAGKAPLIDAGACRRYADRARADFEQRLQEEKSGAAP